MKQRLPAPKFIYLSIGVSLVNSLSVSAQIIPDTTLPNNSLVNPDRSIEQITGGTQVGGNLFHSFEQFDVPTGETAFFDNALTIDNIITRVTGGQISNIDGLIRANGRANLFLLNPSGIAFGENAQLDIGGSFLGSTADSLLFEDGTAFSASNPAEAGTGALPLLSVNVPIGLQFGTNPGSIINRSQAIQVGTGGEDTGVGLQVRPERTLALVGGEVSLEGGFLSSAAGNINLGNVGATLIDNEGSPIDVEHASGGWIEVGAVAGDSQIAIVRSLLNPQLFTLDYEGVENFQDIRLSQLAVIDASGDGGGDIQIQGRHVTLREGSQIRSNTLGTNPGGVLTIRASESLAVAGNTLVDGPLDARLAAAGILTPQETSISTTSFAAGAAGDLRIETERLIVQDGGEISALSFGIGRGGNISIQATESIEIVGEGIPIGFNPSLFSSFGFDNPRFSPRLFREQTLVSIISTGSVGDGPAGNLNIATGQLSIQDGGAIASSPLFYGDGGTLTIAASDSVEVSGETSNGGVRSVIAASSTGAGNAREIDIQTRQLTVRDGGSIQIATLSIGNAGNLSIEASESVDVSGTSSDGEFPSLLSASTLSGGNAGSLTIETDRLRVRDGAFVEVNSTQSGNAGRLNILANSSIQLENGVILNAATVSGIGGNITLQTQSLQLRHGSSLTTNAENTDGGNISIDTETLVALENSDITANAQQGRGGQVTIAAQGIFGTQLRETLTPESDITATSNLGTEFSGTVKITTPEVDTNAGLVDLRGETFDPSDRIVSGCEAAQGNSFTMTGRGGLPEDPLTAIRSYRVWDDLRPLPENLERIGSSENTPIAIEPSPPLIEATDWIRHEDGRVELVASRQNLSPDLRRTQLCRQLHLGQTHSTSWNLLSQEIVNQTNRSLSYVSEIGK